MDSSAYSKRGKTALNIQVSDASGQVIPARVSVKVVNQDLRGKQIQSQENILSAFLLSTDILDKIEQPGYYFNSDDPTRMQELDVLLIGVDAYSFSTRRDTLTVAPESSLKVTGTVSGVFSSKPKEAVGVTLMTFGAQTAFYEQETDSSGQFYFPLPDSYGQHMNILLQTCTQTGKNRDFGVELEAHKAPEISFDQAEGIQSLDSISHFLVQQQREKNAVDQAFSLTGEYMELEEVTVADYLLTPQRKQVNERFGQPDVIIQGHEIANKEEKWSYGLYSVLLFNYSDKIKIERVEGQDGYLQAKIPNGEMTLVVVDGIPVLNYNYALIPNIPPSEVKGVELIEFASNFSSLYREAYPEASPMTVPMIGNVIAIYTHAGNGIFSVQQPTDILKAAIPVFSAEREFESPDYSKWASQDWKKPDLRSLIHWEPNALTDAEGKTTVSFYNADLPRRMLIILEAISEDGRLGYQEIIYEVND